PASGRDGGRGARRHRLPTPRARGDRRHPAAHRAGAEPARRGDGERGRPGRGGLSMTPATADPRSDDTAPLPARDVLAAGTTGGGIAQVAGVGGLETTLFDVDAGALEQAQQAIAAALKKGVELGKGAAWAAAPARHPPR